MDSDYRIAIENGIIRVEPRGLAYYEFVREMLAKVAEVASSAQHARLLFDLRETNYSDDSLVSTIRHVEEAEEVGLGPDFRVAVVGLPNDTMLQYVEDVSVNRGLQVRAFMDEDEAVRWLHGHS